MGGYGSGGWNASGRPTIADVPRVDVNRLNQAGALQVGHSGTWYWNRDAGSEQVQVMVKTDGIVLRSASSSAGTMQVITITWEDCRFGGRRPFFCCPGCAERTLHLYYLGQFSCRACHQLSYPSQRLRQSDRAQHRANKIRVRLGGLPGWYRLPKRPKGMHRRTYLRLISQIAEADIITSKRAEYLFC